MRNVPISVSLLRRRLVLFSSSLFCVIFSESAISDETDFDNVEFNTNLLNSIYSYQIDLDSFKNNNGMQIGEYLAEIWLNDEPLITGKIIFDKVSENHIGFCLKPELLKRLQVQPAALQNTDKLANSSCTEIQQVIRSASVLWDSAKQKLTINIPQRDLIKSPRGSVPVALWQNGSAAAMLSYNMNTYQAYFDKKNFDSQYVNLKGGINISGWNFRHNGNYVRQSDFSSHYQTINTFVQHDLTALRGRLLIGQSNTSGRLFDSVAFTGVSVFSDDLMLAESQRGYAPEVRGIANSHARVTIRQNGNIIYETTVPAGPFVIDDLYPTGYGGDLTVTVRETNGSENTFIVPYAALADLLRPGASRYEAVVGKFRQSGRNDGQPFYQLSWQQGLNNFITLNSGFQLSDGYRAVQIGTALSTKIGAIAIDVTHSETDKNNEKLTGQSYRISYNKLFQETNSNIALAAYRFSTRNYLNFTQAMDYRDQSDIDIDYSNLRYRPKNRYSITLSQGISDDWGTLSLTGLSQNYWNQSQSDLQYQFGYTNRWNQISYSLTAARTRTLNNSTETTWLLSFGLPLGQQRPVTISSSLSYSKVGGLSEQLSVSGIAGERQQMSWGVSGTHDRSNNSSANISAQYISPWTTMDTSVSFGQANRTISAGLSGSIVGHPHGVTLTPYISDSWVVINAPGASGADVIGFSALQIDSNGNAVMPVYTPYQYTTVSIDPKNMSRKIEIENSMQKVVPRAGAVVMAEFATKQGYALLLTPLHEQEALPFGAMVKDMNNNQNGIVGQGGMIYILVKQKSGELAVTYQSQKRKHTCVIPYSLTNDSELMYKISYSCPVTAAN